MKTLNFAKIRHLFSQGTALFLAFIMLFGYIPFSAFAEIANNVKLSPSSGTVENISDDPGNIEKEIKLYEQTLFDVSKKVSISGMLPENAVVSARALTEQEVKDLELVGVKVVFAYDIKIFVNGAEYQPKSPVSVHVAENDVNDDLTVTHIKTDVNGDVSRHEVPSEVNENGDAVFSADSFSVYIGTVKISDTISLEAGSGYKFYSDAACTSELSGAVEWSLSTNIYVKATVEGVSISSVSVRNITDGEVSSYATVTGPSAGVYAVAFSATDENATSQIISVVVTGLPVTIDLGFIPSSFTNDSSMKTLEIPGSAGHFMQSQKTSIEATADTLLSLGTPERFGYQFRGWSKTVGETTTTFSESTVSDTPTASELASGITYTATWEPLSFPLVLSIGTLVPSANVLISFDGSDPSLSVAAFRSANPTYFSDFSDTTLYFETEYIYGETVSDFFTRINPSWVIPQLLDNRSNEEKMFFAGWTVNSIQLLTSSVFSLGNSGILNSEASGSLSAYLASLSTDKTTMMAVWQDYSFVLDVTNKPSDWSFSYTVIDQNDNPVTTALTGSSFSIPRGATVNMSVPVSSNNYITGWNITYTDDLSNIIRIYPLDKPYSQGDTSLNYYFTMPSISVNAVYVLNGIVYANIAESPVTFAENVTAPSGYTYQFGFWYNRRMTSYNFVTDSSSSISVNSFLPLFGTNDISDTSLYGDANGSYLYYFYPWNKTKDFYITSCGSPTQNQLTLIDSINVYFQDVVMVATYDYSSDAVGRFLSGYRVEGSAGNFASPEVRDSFGKYGNVVVNSAYHSKYNPKFYFIGNVNTVATFFPDKLIVDTNHYSDYYFYGVDGGSVTIAGLWGNYCAHFNSLTVNSYDNTSYPDYLDNSEYFCFLVSPTETGGNCHFLNCVINLPNKTIHTPKSANGGIEYDGYYRSNTSIVHIGRIYVMQFQAGGNRSYIHVYNDIMVRSLGEFNLRGSASLVVDGNILGRGFGNSGSITSTGYLIVKGNRAELGRVSITNTTIIANTIVLAQPGSIGANVNLFANVIGNPSSLSYNLNSTTGQYTFTYSGYSNVASTDTFPYTTYFGNSTQASSFSFNGGSIYLYGYYPETGTYSGTVNATDAANPLSHILGEILHEGDLKSEYVQLNKTLSDEAKSSAWDSSIDFTNHECIAFGSSNNQFITANINGSSIYARGNLHFFSKVVMTDGIVICGGVFSSRRDLSVTGGSITAEQVGNTYQRLITESGISRWTSTSLSNCSITAKIIGSTSDIVNSRPSRSTVIVGPNVLLNKWNGNDITVNTDIYINYIYDNSIFTFTPAQDSLRFAKTLNSSGVLSYDAFTGSNVSVSPPNVISPSDPSDSGSWRYGSANGPEVTVFYDNGKYSLAGPESPVFESDHIELYAIKSNYTLSIAEGADKIIYTNVTGLLSSGSATVTYNSNIILNLTTVDLADKIVIWYVDPAGRYHNVMPTFSYNSVSFEMPAYDAEIHITDELQLFLDLYEIAFTSDGFRLEYEETRPDSSFSYKGDLRIKQTNISDGDIVYYLNSEGSVGANTFQIRHATNLSSFGDITSSRRYTGNRMLVEEGGGDSFSTRKITLNGIAQYNSDYSQSGTYVLGSESLTFYIDGPVQINPILGSPLCGNITLIGANGDNTDVVRFRLTSSGINTALRSASSSAVYTVKNLVYSFSGTGWLTDSGSLIFDHSYYNAPNLYANSGIAAGDIRIINSSYCRWLHTGNYGSYGFLYAKSVFIDNSTVETRFGTMMNGRNFFVLGNSFLNNQFEIKDSIVNIQYNYSDDSKLNEITINSNIPEEVIISGNSEITINQRCLFKKLTLKDSASFTITDTENTILECRALELKDSSSLSADFIVVSGFYWGEPQSETSFNDLADSGSGFVDGLSYAGLTISDSAIVYANEFVGGDINSKITINGGTLTSKRIGTFGGFFGYAKALPKSGEANFYIYSKKSRVPVGATITLNSGLINITSNGYLGGINSTVNINGGTVNLADGAIIGMTEADSVKLRNYYSSVSDDISSHIATNNTIHISGGDVSKTGTTGSISSPYGNVTITGETTSVDVCDLKADGGTVDISKTGASNFENPYTGSDKKHNYVGVIVSDELTGRSIAVTDGAVVYALSAVAVVPSGFSGGLVVQKKIDGTKPVAYLYTGGNFGSIGEGTVTNDYDTGAVNAATINVFGSQVVNIIYVINRDGIISSDDLAFITYPSGENISYYNVETDTNADDSVRYVALKDPDCLGYVFDGWVDENGEPVTRIDRMIRTNRTFYATWHRRILPFRIYVTLTNHSDATAAMTQVGSSDLFYFNTLAYAEYGSSVLGIGANKVNLAAYTTNSDVINEVICDDSVYVALLSGGSNNPVSVDTIVNKNMVRTYLQKIADGDDSDDFVILSATSSIRRSIGFMFFINLDGAGRPVNAYFNNAETPSQKNSLRILSYIPINVNLGNVHSGVTNGTENQLMLPTAPGYTFGGWYDNASCTGTVYSGNEAVSTLLAGGISEFYAKWTPNAYKIEFIIEDSVTEHTWITPSDDGTDATRPAEYDAGTNPGYKTLYYSWIYDTPITAANFRTTYSYKNMLGSTVSGTDESYYVLPTGWREGYVFIGWRYTIGETDYSLSVDDELNIASFSGNLNTDAASGTVAITFTATFEKATVTYHVTKGAFSEGASADITGSLSSGSTYVNSSLAYKDPLAAYFAEPGSGSASTYNVVASNTVSGAVDYGYGVKSTTAAYFEDPSNASSPYHAGDFREVISRKGYTFNGWTKYENGTGGNYYSAPRFENIEVYDQWSANTYNLKIYGLDASEYAETGHGDYTSVFSADAVSSSGFGDSVRSGYPLSVTVGSSIPANSFPAREGSDLWYAINDLALGDNYKRYLLGITFVPLDPGTSKVSGADVGGADVPENESYRHYAEAINRMYASGTLLQETTGLFYLPEDDSYRTDIGDATVVNGSVSSVTVVDYPSGSTIKTYGVYRERSLVIVERYMTDVENRRIVYAGPWQTWYDVSGYDRTVIENQGFQFTGFYVNSVNVRSGWEYPGSSTVYDNNKDSNLNYKQDATDKGIYDIMVYSVYVPVDNKEITLNAGSDPTAALPSDTYVYTMPSSVQSGYMSFSVHLPSGVYLTTVSDMTAHRLTDTWGTDNTADNTVAVMMTIHAFGDPGNSVPAYEQTYDLADYLGLGSATWFADGSSEQVVRAGDTVTLTLYHSGVMTQEQLLALYSSVINTIEFRFDNDTDHTNANTLNGQAVNMMINVQLVDSLYTVHYVATLPENVSALTVSDLHGFTSSGTTSTLNAVNVPYGQIKDQLPPLLEGYQYVVAAVDPDHPVITADPSYWSVTSGPASGEITVHASYIAILYKLIADGAGASNDGTLDHWTVTYTDGLSGSESSSSPLDAAAGEDLKYHSTVTFVPKSGADQYAEFVTLIMKIKDTDTVAETHILSEYIGVGGNGVLRMPAYDVYVVYSDVKTLYLDNGSILLTDTGFKQKSGYSDSRGFGDISETVWHGDYIILQNAANNTAAEDAVNNPGWVNILSLKGDLTKRSSSDSTEKDITLGNIKIETSDSIVLEPSSSTKAKVEIGSDTITGSIEGKSIRVPSDAELNLTSGMSENSDVDLSPSSGAAIGGSASSSANGVINLSNLDISMDLSASQTASGIGKGAYTGTGNDITVSNCNITVSESGAGSWNGGAWIGGKDVSSVTLTNSTVSRSSSQGDAVWGFRLADADVVNINTSNLGTSGRALFVPIHADETLNIANSSLYLENRFGLGSHSMIGTDDGITSVTNSAVQVAYSGTASADDLYTGVLKIMDVTSDVTVNATQILEVSHDDITITSTGVTQGSSTHTHPNLGYLLLEELPAPATANDFTVTSISSGKNITVRQPHTPSGSSDPVNPAVILKDAAFNENTSVVLNGNLTVTGTTSVADNKLLSVTGNTSTLTLNGGLTESEGSFSQTGGSLVRTNADLAIGGNMTLSGVAANVGTGKIGSTGYNGNVTTVNISESDVTADSIGALGALNDTFTFVVLGTGNTLNGTVYADRYRLSYVVSSNMDTSDLATVLRTKALYVSGVLTGSETTVTESKYMPGGVYVSGVPSDPSVTLGSTPPFMYWYILDENGLRVELASSYTHTDNMTGATVLDAGTTSTERTATSPSDGTETLLVHAWSYSGSASVKPYRLIREFNDGTNSVTVQTNQAFTIDFTAQGAMIAGHDYAVVFSSALPVGTALALTKTGSSSYTYYYYKVTTDDTVSVRFSDFVRMDTSDTHYSGTELSNERFLLSCDFAGTNAAEVTNVTVGFELYQPGDTAAIPLLSAPVRYSLTSVTKGVISMSGSTISVDTAPAGDVDLAGKHLYLVGSLTKNAKMFTRSQRANILFNTGSGDNPGIWISGNTVIYDVGEYGSTASDITITYSGFIPGTYQADWMLCYAPDAGNNNIVNLTISNVVAESSRTVSWTAHPSLSVASPSTVLYKQGEAHTLTFTLSTLAAYGVSLTSVTPEKQTAIATFVDESGISCSAVPVAVASGSSQTYTVTLPSTLAAGTYRIVFSIDDGTSINDNVYYSFIVK